MIKIEDYKNCPECEKPADLRILRIYDDRHKNFYNMKFGHCQNKDCSITYFKVSQG